VRAAERGDFATLGREVAAKEKIGKLTNGEAADIARAVAGWEIARGPKDEQLARVRELRACARAIDGELARRMKGGDGAAAEAALARVEAGGMSKGAARAHADDKDDGWRAVGARGLVRERDAAARSRAFVDGAPGVRRAAMHAALEARDPRDVDALAEAARLDPEPIVRTDAIRALGAVGGDAAAAKLRDLVANADGPLREDIASAWASPALWDFGGRDELRILVSQVGGPAAIEAAAAVLRAPKHDSDLDAAATALLARTVAGTGKASHRDRVHAIAVLPRPSGALLDALHEASKDQDVTIQVAALARLVDSTADREASVHALEAIAGGASRLAAASKAKLALATARDLRVQAWIEADLASPDPSTRFAAVTALAALGRSGRAAVLLADADPSLRTRAACTLLLAPEK
jgi:hypothetical protein